MGEKCPEGGRGMSLPDVVLDASMAMSRGLECKDRTMSGGAEGKDRTSTDSGMDSGGPRCTLTPSTPSPHSSRSTSSRSGATSSHSRCSMISMESCGSDCLSSLDEGEAEWDALGRMSSIRRSNRFDKPQLLTVMLKREKDGYGLELEGRSPPTIASVCGSAGESGIRAGDRLLEVNGQSVRGLDHVEAGRMIAEAEEPVTLLLHTVKPTPTPAGQVVYSGWLNKRGGSGMTPRNWRRRWFVVRDDCIAYYYASPTEARPLGAIVLRNYTVSKAKRDVKKSFAFKIVKGGARSYYFAADCEADMNKWAQVFTEASTLEGREQVHFSGMAHNVSLSALSIKDPDCHGWLHKQGHGIKTWKRRYCVLKAHQLFYYGKMSHTTAYGVMNLTGYQILRGRSKDKKFYFQAAPPDRRMREFHFYASSDGERERWMEAMRKSVALAK